MNTPTGPQAQEAGEYWTDAQCLEFASVAFRHARKNLPRGVTLIDIRLGAKRAMDAGRTHAPERAVSHDLAAAVAAMKFDVYELTTPELQAAFDGNKTIAVVQIDTVKALKAALSTLQSGAEGKENNHGS